jgi:hypothetical protein
MTANYGTCAPAVYADGCCETRPNHPVLGFIGRAIMRPIRAAAGCLMPARTVVVEEPAPRREDVARMIMDGGYSPAEISAAKIKMDESQARARRAAVRYLSSVDCFFYPEAEAGLVAALRSDRSELVRYEAAMALGNCARLTDRMVEALNMTALAVELDGNPMETSDRVRLAAKAALERGVSRGAVLRPIPQAHILPPVVDWLPPVAPMLPMLPPVPVAPPPMEPMQRMPAGTEALLPDTSPMSYPALGAPMMMPAVWQAAYQLPTSPPMMMPVAYQMPAMMPAYQPGPAPTALVSAQEREQAEMVSNGAVKMTTAPPTPAAAAPRNRPLMQFLSSLGWSREPPRGQADPRLQGLTPIGADAGMSISGR